MPTLWTLAAITTISQAGPISRPLTPSEPALQPMSTSSGRSRVGIAGNMAFGLKARFIAEAFTSTGKIVDPDPVPQDIFTDRSKTSEKDDAVGGELFYEYIFTEDSVQSWGLHVSAGYNRAEFSTGHLIDTFSDIDGSFLGQGVARHDLDIDLWHVNLGIVSEARISDKVYVKVGAGVSAGYAQGDYRYDLPFGAGTERVEDDDFLFGAYVDLTVGYDFTPNWSVFGGVRYQYFEEFELDGAASGAEFDVSGSFVGSVGMRWSF